MKYRQLKNCYDSIKPQRVGIWKLLHTTINENLILGSHISKIMMSSHILKIVVSSHVSKIILSSHISKILKTVMPQLVESLIFSRLDYWNSL